MYLLPSVVLLGALSVTCATFTLAAVLQNSWPHNYTGIPAGDYNTEWQDYFEVTEPLPNITTPLSRSFAGSISTDRPGHPNDTLFFWGFETRNGSLTAPADESSDEPWAIWLNGGPGASSFVGLFVENGPLHVTANKAIVPNNYSWDRLMDVFWLDQPVATGFSTVEANGGYAADEDQIAEDFLAFLSNLVKVFPNLARRPFYLMGESYGARFIFYIAKALFASPNPPVKIAKIVVGNGMINSFPGYEELSVMSVIETYPQIIGFDSDVYNYFKNQTHLCQYDLNLTYPQHGPLPSLISPKVTVTGGYPVAGSPEKRSLKAIAGKFAARNENAPLTKRDLETREESRQQWKRDAYQRMGLNPHYGCYLWEELTQYAVNYTFPWTNGLFDGYYIPDALNPEVHFDPYHFLNNDQTRAALHAPTSKNWTLTLPNYYFGSSLTPPHGANEFGDPSPPPMTFMTELATHATAKNVTVVLYSGNDDSIAPHFGTEVVIQNTTFGGIRGFRQKPSTLWYGFNGSPAGIIHQERGWMFATFLGAGHQVPEYQPENAYAFIRDFVVGNNQTGLLVPGASAPIGGMNPAFTGGIMPGNSVIFYGSGTTSASTIAPSASFAAWSSFLQTAVAAAAGTTPTAMSSVISTSSTLSSSTPTAIATTVYY